jgi:lipopolysaccharide transport system permease protein
LSPPPVTLIRPARAWQLINFRELWQARELIFILAWRDVKVRYKQTLLGAAWAVLQPGMMMVVFTIFFGRLAHVSSGDVDYSVVTPLAFRRNL